jgi:SNF2 family DNA or RNA helicase
MEMSGKMLVLMDIVKQAKEQGHKTIVFSQYQVRNAKPYTMCPLP